MHQSVQALAAPDGHLQRVQGQVGAQRPRPPADRGGEGIDDESHIDEPGPGRHVGEVGDPRLVGPGAEKSRSIRSAPHGACGHGACHADALQTQLPSRSTCSGPRDPREWPRPCGAETPKCSAWTRRISTFSWASRTARADRGPGGSRWTGRSAAPGRSARPRVLVLVDVGDHLVGRRSSSARRKPPRTSGSHSPDAVRDLTLQRLQPLALVGGQPWPQPIIGLGPTTHCAASPPTSRTVGDRGDRRPRGVLVLVLEHQPDGTLPQLLGIPAWSCHGSNLSRVEASRNPGAFKSTLRPGRARHHGRRSRDQGGDRWSAVCTRWQNGPRSRPHRVDQGGGCSLTPPVWQST